jgi:hypothetical protein
LSNKDDKKKQAQLNEQQQQLNTEAVGDRTAARAEDTLDTPQRNEALGYFNFLADPNHDFTKLPGLAYSGMFEDGAAGAEEERTALGAGRFGASAADPNLQAVLAANTKERRVQRRGESLERAAQTYDAKIRGVSADLATREQNRRLGLAGMTTGAGQNALNTYAQYQVRPHWGLTLLTAAAANAASAASAAAAAP